MDQSCAMLLEVSDLPQGCLEIPAILTFTGGPNQVEKFKNLLKVVTVMEEKSDVKNPGNDNGDENECKKRKLMMLTLIVNGFQLKD